MIIWVHYLHSINQENNFAPQLFIKRNLEEKFRVFHGVYDFTSWLCVYCVDCVISQIFNSTYFASHYLLIPTLGDFCFELHW